jgi:outer membrane protein TolC
VAIAEYYPKVSLSALLGFESLRADRLFSAEAFQPAAVAGLRWRLFDFGRVDAEVAKADAATAEALARYRQSVLRAAEDVENSFMALVQLEAQSEELASEVLALTRARRVRARGCSKDRMPGPNVPIAQLVWANAEPLHGVRPFYLLWNGLNYPADTMRRGHA